MNRVLAAFLFFCLAGCASSALTSTGEVDVRGLSDPLEEAVTISTVAYERPLLITTGRADPAFRAFVGKETGAAIYQVYIRTDSRDWMRWDEGRTRINGETIRLTADMLGRDVSCVSDPCDHYETVGLDVEREVLQNWAEGGGMLRLYSGRSTATIDIPMPARELRDFLGALARVQTEIDTGK